MLYFSEDMATFYDGLKEKTEVIYPNEGIIGIALQDLSKTRKSLDIVGDCDGPSFLVTNERIATKYLELKNKGVKIRQITEITKDNILYCKKVMDFSDLRHLDGVKGNYGINDRRTFGSIIIDQESKKPLHFVHSNVKPLVEQEQYVFETLWSKAIPAKERIREIEEGAKREFIETIRDFYEIQKLSFDLIKLAEEEILLIFSTINAFRYQQRAGALQLLQQAAARDVKVLVLVPRHIKIKEILDHLKRHGIESRNNKKPLRAKVTTFVVDKALSLTVELRGEPNETSEEASGLATYSNSESTVLAYFSIFEMMWMESESGYRDSNKKQRPQEQQEQKHRLKYNTTNSKVTERNRPKLFY